MGQITPRPNYILLLMYNRFDRLEGYRVGKMKSIRYSILAALFGLSILLAGCGLGEGATPTPTPTPEPISKLAMHAEKPFIRGDITSVFYEDDGKIRAIHVEGLINDDTKVDAAAVQIIPATKVFELTSNGYYFSNIDKLAKGEHVEILITGKIIERYPPIVIADEILILP